MAVNYVKFYRGSTTAFKNVIKNKDTLYFITDSNSTKGSLYLGEKLIASNISSIKDFEDILLTNLKDSEVLLYNEELKKWVNKPLASAIGFMIGATETQPGIEGLVPTPSAGQQNYFLRGDGTWSSIENYAYSNIIELEATQKDDINKLINNWFIANKLEPKNSDVAIIKINLENGDYSYTSYIYSGSDWVAFTGSYNASNIYFTDDLQTTTDIGYIKVGKEGVKTIEAKGKSIKQVFENLFYKELDPIVTPPSLIIHEPVAQQLEVGTYFTPTWKLSLNPGEYEYGPNTGVTISNWEVYENSGNKINSSEGSFPERRATTSDYSFKIKAYYTKGTAPFTNLKNKKEDLAISSGVIEKFAPSITGYRNSFYGSFNSKDFKITSNHIRTLTPSNKALVKGSAFSVQVPIGSQRIVIAYPVVLGEITSICDKNGLGANIKSGFQISQVNVEGANGYDAIPYYVYFMDRAEPNKTLNYYDIII